MNWVKKYKLPAIEAIQFNRRPCTKIDNLWQALHLSFNLAHNHQTYSQLLKKIPCKEITKWNLFSKEEFISTIERCNNLDISRKSSETLHVSINLLILLMGTST